MQRTFLSFFCFLVFSSCALTSKYQIRKHNFFAKSLTEADVIEVEKDGGTLKHWAGTNKYGDSEEGDFLVLKTARLNYYSFVEVGEWVENFAILTVERFWVTINKNPYLIIVEIYFLSTYILNR